MSSATGHFLAQRISAVVLVFLGLWLAGSLYGLSSFEHAIVVEFVAGTLNSVLLILLCITLSYHSYLGVQVVIDDYVHAPGLNTFSLLASRLMHIVVVLASTYAIYKVGFGA